MILHFYPLSTLQVTPSMRIQGCILNCILWTKYDYQNNNETTGILTHALVGWNVVWAMSSYSGL